VRNVGPESARQQLDELLALNSPAVVGITLGGSEDCFPHDAFRDVYALARDRGLRLSVHAGEALGPESVWQALEALRPDRIGHGVRASEDQALVVYLAERQIPLEVCPTSNVFTGAYPSYQAHPARSLFAAGIPVTINSDDPTFFHTTLTDEYARLPALGFTDRDVLGLVRNGFRCAFLPQADIAQYLHRLDAAWGAATALS
jgi:adenosine deaminase